MQAAQMTTAAFDTALSEEHLRPQETVEIKGTAEETGECSDQDYRRQSASLPSSPRSPDAGEDWGQVLLYTDEAA